MGFLKSLLFAVIVITNIFCVHSQTNMAVSLIPDSLKKNAFSIVREENTVFEYKSARSAVQSVTYLLTVLNEKGKNEADFGYTGDQFRKLKSFSGKLYDAQGNLLRKFKQSDIQTSEWNSGLASDDKYYYYKCNAPSYPFTVFYEFEVEWNDGILTFPMFAPTLSFNKSVQKSSYKLVIPENVIFRSKAFNMDAKAKTTTIKGVSTHEWLIDNINAIDNEPLDFSIKYYVPHLYLTPVNFIYDKISGSITDWQSMGKWNFSLLEGRSELPIVIQDKVLELTKNATTDREKVKILYDFLGETTHYVSIQLGIGGFQPMPASEVCRTNFGDCKALSNYLKALLSVVGINSNYCTIILDEREKYLITDYANFQQMNHVILQVPLYNDTLYLECTNPKTPFGFVHNSISGHDGLICSKEGGKIARLPDYADSLNIDQHTATVNIEPDGQAKVKLKKEWKLKIYDDYSGFSAQKNSDQKDLLRKGINLPNVTMGDIKVTEDKSKEPSITMDYSWTTTNYGTKTGSRLFIPLNIYRDGYEKLKLKNRKHNFWISSGFRDVDSIQLFLPDGFEIESIPTPIMEKTKFGTFTSNVIKTENRIQIIQIVNIFSGYYLSSEYQSFIAFMNNISTAYKSKIVIRKLNQ